MQKKHLCFLILFTLAGCRQEVPEWNPIFEDTNFEYLKTNIERSISSIHEAYSEAGKANEESLQNTLQKAESRLLEIKDYYLPLTTVRQKVYDAERYFRLDQAQKSKVLLQDAITLVSTLNVATTNAVFNKVILELNTMINEVIVSTDKESKADTNTKMKTLGEHVNLMLSRGNLVLSGIEFDR